MKCRTFYNEEQAGMYLVDSIIRYHGEPIMVCNVIGGPIKYSITYKRVKDGERGIVIIPNKFIDMTPVPLGLMNYRTRRGSLYCINGSRVPTRSWKVGLYSRNFRVKNIMGGPVEDVSYILQSAYLYDLVMGKYPSYKEAREFADVAGPSGAWAFSRRFAVDYRGDLRYKYLKEPVGDNRGGRPVLNDDFLYLTQALEEDQHA